MRQFTISKLKKIKLVKVYKNLWQSIQTDGSRRGWSPQGGVRAVFGRCPPVVRGPRGPLWRGVKGGVSKKHHDTKGVGGQQHHHHQQQQQQRQQQQQQRPGKCPLSGTVLQRRQQQQQRH